MLHMLGLFLEIVSRSPLAKHMQPFSSTIATESAITTLNVLNASEPITTVAQAMAAIERIYNNPILGPVAKSSTKLARLHAIRRYVEVFFARKQDSQDRTLMKNIFNDTDAILDFLSREPLTMRAHTIAALETVCTLYAACLPVTDPIFVAFSSNIPRVLALAKHNAVEEYRSTLETKKNTKVASAPTFRRLQQKVNDLSSRYRQITRAACSWYYMVRLDEREAESLFNELTYINLTGEPISKKEEDDRIFGCDVINFDYAESYPYNEEDGESTDFAGRLLCLHKFPSRWFIEATGILACSLSLCVKPERAESLYTMTESQARYFLHFAHEKKNTYINI